MVVIHKIPIPPPSRSNATSKTTLTADQQTKETFVFQHFSRDEYVLPDVSKEKGTLTEEEKFWLVSGFGGVKYATSPRFFVDGFSRHW